MLTQNQLRKIKNTLSLIFVFGTAVATPLVFALDNASQDALSKTQVLLNDSDQRQKAIKGDGKAMKIDEAVKGLANGDSKLSGEVYALAAEVLENVVKGCDGDPERMQEALERFSKNPESFAQSWTPAQKAKLRDLGDKLNANAANSKKN